MFIKYILYFSYSSRTISIASIDDVQVSSVGVLYSAIRGNHPNETSSILPEIIKSTFSFSFRYSYALIPSVTSSAESAFTNFMGRPPRTPPAAFISSIAISAPLSVLLPVSLANDPINPTTTGFFAANAPCCIPTSSKRIKVATTVKEINHFSLFISSPPVFCLWPFLLSRLISKKLSHCPAGEPPISAKLFCKHSQITFISLRVVLKNEHRTSNVQRRMKNKHPIPNIQHLFLFLHLFPLNIRCWTFDVRCSFFFS